MTSTGIRRTIGALVTVSTLALIVSCGQQAAETSTTSEAASSEAPAAADTDTGATADSDAAPTIDDAQAFIEKVEKTYREFGEYSARVAWAQATNITYDTNWLATKVGAEGTKMGVEAANEAKRFNDLELPTDMRRKIEKIKLGVNVPAPSTDGAATELSEVANRMRSQYATGKITLDGEEVGRNDLEEMMGNVRDADKLKEIWTKWREVPVADYEDADGGSMKGRLCCAWWQIVQ